MALTKLNFGGKQQALVATNIPTLTGTQLPVGSIIQVIKNDQHDSSTETAISSTTYADVTGWTASITPTFANSLIKVEAHAAGLSRGSGTNLKLKLLRGSDTVIEMTRFQLTESGGTWGDSNTTFIGYDSTHNSTSALTYKIQLAFKSSVSNMEVRTGSFASSGEKGYVSFTLTEIKQ